MLIFTKIDDLRAYLSRERSKGLRIGFVPTMGALHPGHISLVKIAGSECDIIVSSIFVNPTQFNDKSDLAKYPRTPEKDIQLLTEAGCHVVFMPDEKEIYPETDNRSFKFGHLDYILEGAHRPGHFNGVAQVVSKLFSYVQPDKAFFGEKDFQQVMVIKDLVKQLDLPIEIISCPIIRESDGLAMSSRNTLLSADERKAASIIPDLINQAKILKRSGQSLQSIKTTLIHQLSKDPIYRLNYLTFCNADDLIEIQNFSDAKRVVMLIACYVGKVRLIDNVVFN